MTKDEVIKQLEEKCKVTRFQLDNLHIAVSPAVIKHMKKELELFQEILILLKLKEE